MHLWELRPIRKWDFSQFLNNKFKKNDADVKYLTSTLCKDVNIIKTASVVQWSDFLAANPDVPGSIRGVVRFSE
jgi:hypothetical protein